MMPNVFERRLAIPGAYNIRDLGGYRVGDGETLWRRILRADGLHRVAPTGVQELYDAGVRTVIDLRHATELATQPNPLSRHPDVLYRHIPLFAQLAPLAEPEPSVRKRNVLLELYLLALATRQSAICEVLAAIAEAGDGAVLFHCTAGKDRTGIIAALILGIVGADRSTITNDYALTAALIAPMIEEILANAEARGIDRDHLAPLLACESETMQAMLDHLDEHYCGVDGYLAQIGLERVAIARIRERLIGSEAKQRVA